MQLCSYMALGTAANAARCTVMRSVAVTLTRASSNTDERKETVSTRRGQDEELPSPFHKAASSFALTLS